MPGDQKADPRAADRELIEEMAAELRVVVKMARRCEPLTGPDLDELGALARRAERHAAAMKPAPAPAGEG